MNYKHFKRWQGENIIRNAPIEDEVMVTPDGVEWHMSVAGVNREPELLERITLQGGEVVCVSHAADYGYSETTRVYVIWER